MGTHHGHTPALHRRYTILEELVLTFLRLLHVKSATAEELFKKSQQSSKQLLLKMMSEIDIRCTVTFSVIGTLR
jgi:hypothetical protein